MYVLIGNMFTNCSQVILLKADESTHSEACKSTNAKTGCDANPIKCEQCDKDVDFSDYENHTQQHKALLRQFEEEKALHGIVPCEFCAASIPFINYDKHINSEHKSPNPKQPAPTIPAQPEIKVEGPAPQVELPSAPKQPAVASGID